MVFFSLTSVVAQNAAPHPEQTLQLAAKSDKAMRVARERYQFALWFMSKAGVWPISRMIGDYEHAVLFPLGTSDRAYVFLFPDYGYGGKVESKVLCYQRKCGKYVRVYVVINEQRRKASKSKPVKQVTHPDNLFDYLSGDRTGSFYGDVPLVLHELIQGSHFAKTDLATKRDYVKYDYDGPEDTLSVSLLSKSASDTDVEYYFLGEDPLTKESLYKGKTFRQNGVEIPREIVYGKQLFYEKYGLPVRKEELGLFSQSPL